MPTSKPLPTPAARLRAYVTAHEATSNLSEQVTALSWIAPGGVDTTAPLLLNDIRQAAEALEPRVSGTVTQYGIRFPDGSVVWATEQDAVTLTPDGLRVRPLLSKASVDPSEYAVDLTAVLAGSDGGHARRQFYVQAENLAAAARIDPEEYIAGLTIVRRTLRTIVGDFETLEFHEPAEESPSS